METTGECLMEIEPLELSINTIRSNQTK